MMRTRTLAAAVLALAIIGGAADSVRADAPRFDRRPPGADRRSGAASRPSPRDARQQSLLDQLDDARINRDLQEMEVAADKAQIQKMMTVLRETELMPIQGFSQGPIIGGSDPEERAANLEKYKQKLDHVCADFVIKSKELSRERRRVAELEAELGLTAAAPGDRPGACARACGALAGRCRAGPRPDSPRGRNLAACQSVGARRTAPRSLLRRPPLPKIARSRMPSGSSTCFAAGWKAGGGTRRMPPRNDLCPRNGPTRVGARSKPAPRTPSSFSTCSAAGLKAGKAGDAGRVIR